MPFNSDYLGLINTEMADQVWTLHFCILVSTPYKYNRESKTHVDVVKALTMLSVM